MQSKKFGVIGHPIKHSLSKPMHEAVFKKLNLPHTYDAININPENLENFIKTNSYDGINVTIPHKVEVMKYLDRISNEAKKIQAVNTITFNQAKIGYNTDYIGFLKSLEAENINLENKNILVIGAGGVSRAILVALAKSNTNITLTNRTKQKATDLIKQLNINAKIIDYNYNSLKQHLTTPNHTHLIINTTSIGMKSSGHLPPPTSHLLAAETKGFSPASIGMHLNENQSPLPKEFLSQNQTIFDVIYNPLKTQLIKDAEQIGCKTISGVNMLVHQGAQSLRIWLNIEPPIQTMKDAVLKNLHPN